MAPPDMQLRRLLRLRKDGAISAGELAAGVLSAARPTGAAAPAAFPPFAAEAADGAPGRRDALRRAAAEGRLLDVRSASDFAAGHVPGSVCIPLGELGGRLYELPPVTTPVAVVAASKEDAVAAARHIRMGKGTSIPALTVLWSEAAALARGLPERPCQGSQRLWLPSALVESAAPTVERHLGGPGRVLDVGCGQGRDMAFLGQRGWQVHGVDNRAPLLRSAEELCLRFAGRQAETKCCDLKKEWPYPPGLFDLVICVRFLLRSCLGAIRDAVRPGGFILYSHFIDGVQHIGTPKSPHHYLQHGELHRVFVGWEILKHKRAFLDDGRPLVDFLARRPR
eukprot:TRINITY_DN27714_c0_g1_i2.p1 TRINITY_DN27714_c0_g1~~TRINITY_DN27714_c0_g1_i2.p1  ORF type:complete len:360 (+),score=84.44 TRINITY_DN27714_c0_g1_i2:69-1082(+)